MSLGAVGHRVAAFHIIGEDLLDFIFQTVIDSNAVFKAHSQGMAQRVQIHAIGGFKERVAKQALDFRAVFPKLARFVLAQSDQNGSCNAGTEPVDRPFMQSFFENGLERVLVGRFDGVHHGQVENGDF